MTPIEQNFAKRSPLNQLHFPIPPLSNLGDCGKIQLHLQKTGIYTVDFPSSVIGVP